MRKVLLLFVLLIGSLVLGQNKHLEKTLENQLEYGKPTFDNPYLYTEKDLSVTIPIINEILIDNGYQKISNENFNSKIKFVGFPFLVQVKIIQYNT